MGLTINGSPHANFMNNDDNEVDSLVKNETAQMLVRKAVTMAAGLLVGKGLVDAKDVSSTAIDLLSGTLLLILSWWWSNRIRRRKDTHIANLQAVAAAAVEETTVFKKAMVDKGLPVPDVKVTVQNNADPTKG
jgi:hypothetical protein